MKKLIILFIFISPQFIFAQSNSSIDIAIAINSSYRTLEITDRDEFHATIFNDRQRFEKTKIKYAIGIHYNKSLTENWILRSGLRYTQMGFESDYDTGLQWPSQQNGSGAHDPNLPSLEPQYGGEPYDYAFVDFAILIRKHFSKKNWSPFFEAGIIPSYLMSPNGNLLSSSINKFQLAGVLSVGVNYSFSNYQIFFQPAFRYHITNTVGNATIKEHLYAGGIEVGIRKIFGEMNVN